MGFLSSLFDFGDKPTTTSGGQTMTPVIPEMLKPNVQEVVDASQSLYKQRLGEGYKPYTGQTIAGFSPEEVAAQEGLKSLVGTQAPLQQEAINMARGQAREFTPETAQQYMSPYLRTALDAQKAQAQRQYESVQQPKFEAAAVAAGGMSGLGSRAAVQAAEMDSNQQRMLADIEAAGQQQAYESAAQLFQDQTNRERQAASQISTAAPNIYKANVQDMGLLSQIGEDKRGLAQGVLDEAYSKYIEQEQFPEQQLARYQSSIYGSPLLKQQSYSNTVNKTGGGPSTGKTLLGLGAGIMGFGGNNSIGSSLMGGVKSFFKKSGGGIGSTMKAQEYVNRNMGGPVMPPVVYRQQPGLVDPNLTARENQAAIRATEAQRRRDLAENETRPTAEEMTTRNNALLAQQAEEIRQRQLATASPRKIEEMKRIEAATEAPPAPVVATSEEASEPDAALAGAKDEAFSAKFDADKNMAAITQLGTIKSALDASKENPDAIQTIRDGFSNYKKSIAPFVEADPYRQQKFWSTISAAIMQPGNAWANMMKGYKQAIDGLDASAKDKQKMMMSLAGKELSTETAVAGIQDKREGRKNELLKQRLLSRAKNAKERRDLINRMQSAAFTNLLKKKPDVLEKSLESLAGKNKILKEKIDAAGGDVLKEKISSQMLQGLTYQKAVKAVIDSL